MEQKIAAEESAPIESANRSKNPIGNPSKDGCTALRNTAEPGFVRRFDELMERFDNDVELLLEIAQLFIDDCPARLTALCAAREVGDLKALEAVAHSLKGSAASFGADLARLSAQRVEQLARGGDLPRAAAAAAVLQLETEDLIADLKEVLHYASETHV